MSGPRIVPMTKKGRAKGQKTWLNKTDLAAFFGISPRTIEKWVQVPGFPGPQGHKYDLLAVCKWYIERELKARSKTGAVSAMTAIRLENQREQVRARKLKNDLMEGNLVPKDIAKRALDEVVTICTTRVSALPGQIAGAVGVDVRRLVEPVAKHYCDSALADIAGSADDGKDSSG